MNSLTTKIAPNLCNKHKLSSSFNCHENYRIQTFQFLTKCLEHENCKKILARNIWIFF